MGLSGAQGSREAGEMLSSGAKSIWEKELRQGTGPLRL
jgi:hypothetical protein